MRPAARQAASSAWLKASRGFLGITDALGKAGGGAATGSAVAGIAGALGINLSNTGSQIGGAIGSFLPIPGGDIIGAIAGGIIGKLIGGTKRGSATIGGTGSSLSVTGTRGNSSSFINASSTAGGSIIEGVNRIAEAFGASVNAALGSVSIGLRDGKYRVDTSGSGITKTSKGAVDFGKDGAADAIYFATLDLIKDGVIQGLRDGTQRLLQASDDLETGLQKALDFEDVFNQLKAIKDPVGAALDALDKQFSRLDIIFQEAGATAEEYAQLEEYYGIKRNEAIRQAAEQSFGSLKDLLDELNIGDRGLSLSERNANASSQYAELAARVQAGDVTAFNDYAAAASTLLDIRREIFGSQSGYFDTFNSIRDLSNRRSMRSRPSPMLPPIGIARFPAPARLQTTMLALLMPLPNSAPTSSTVSLRSFQRSIRTWARSSNSKRPGPVRRRVQIVSI